MGAETDNGILELDLVGVGTVAFSYLELFAAGPHRIYKTLPKPQRLLNSLHSINKHLTYIQYLTPSFIFIYSNWKFLYPRTVTVERDNQPVLHPSGC